ncbi:glycosyltransferase [Buttiauxella sp. B2]|uniref:glycosyltransferase n=1 Tax=Buttiauxella sp. B2 TaxID=2587812 RepID=UPI0011228EF4|nr:glycosyltransferase [Buttiauxella sp. B2]TNV18996.1 glycosyltransferase [Buttiauxella sp. B2]
MKFSVLMSLYHKESAANLDDCLLSLYNQTLTIPEVICVYDGPVSKELDDIVMKWASKLPIKTVKLDRNVGLGNALNEGLKHCSYDFVARMDTDDICVETRFSEQIAYLEKNPQTAILGSNTLEFESDENIITSSRIVPSSSQDIVKYASLKNPFNHMSVIFNKNTIISVGGYRHHYLMEDYNLWLRVLATSCQVANIESYLVKVRAGDGMIARRRGLLYIKSEYQLAYLKYKLKFQSLPISLTYFFIRSLPRLLPVPLLRYLYKKSRRINN